MPATKIQAAKTSLKTSAPKTTIEAALVEITAYANRPKAFWADMGPFFARREVRREMPYLIDEDGYVWFVARAGGQVIGFVAYDLTKGGKANIHGLYVIPEQRGNGIAEALLNELLNHVVAAGAKTVAATAAPKSVALFEKQGFLVTTEKGQYRVMEATPEALKR